MFAELNIYFLMFMYFSKLVNENKQSMKVIISVGCQVFTYFLFSFSCTKIINNKDSHACINKWNIKMYRH